jgi:2-oxoglutarate ferredoxin oxidoreductase subunit delta
MGLFKSDMPKKQLPATGKWSVTVERDFCKACRFCIDVCPVDVFRWDTEVNAIGWFPIEVAHEDKCVGCMLCYQVCPDFVINVEAKTRPSLDPNKRSAGSAPEAGAA